jgi:hypothetical protein
LGDIASQRYSQNRQENRIGFDDFYDGTTFLEVNPQFSRTGASPSLPRLNIAILKVKEEADTRFLSPILLGPGKLLLRRCDGVLR